jgi:hypothetical protein
MQSPLKVGAIRWIYIVDRHTPHDQEQGLFDLAASAARGVGKAIREIHVFGLSEDAPATRFSLLSWIQV